MKGILIKPIVTEKATKSSENLGVYSFEVGLTASKINIKNEVEKIFNVNVEDVRTMRYYRKVKTKHTKKGLLKGKSKAYKKAIVKVSEGQEIDIYNV